MDVGKAQLNCNCLFFYDFRPKGHNFFGSNFTGSKTLRLNGFQNSCRSNAEQFESLAMVIFFPIARNDDKINVTAFAGSPSGL